ncbi:Radical SAM superfamily enzyme, MoaA/NifB/PqqE/SkfB family [Flexibacter flexilis DSM 6793]|uniref:Radical SAM superfamily enzyme, MoaA/NifB/PqqE/SkfB family n=1 Tax=Flexibacter flexilis DSM 6793 TaxID=927664 RepID=A0A1I1HDA0_9BACT|nr:radical SAM protein [Flexibacter flexilis]SFC19958.1 Radical SAM superfamily enzyme, MoaA/NifB/PqqE/SkfB family [Flexibacter flexilis DSM 6793]
MARLSPQQTQRLSDFRTNAAPLLGPESVGIVPTNACNLNCITCWSYSPLLNVRPNTQWKRKQLDWPVLRQLLDDLAALQTQRIILTGGGDPLVYPQFDETVRHAKNLGLKVTLISNLTLIKDLDTFLSLGIDTIQANFSAADAQSYVAFHPNRKASDYEHFLHKIQKIAACTPDLKLVCVICQTNAHLLAQMLELAASFGTKIQFKLMSIGDGTEQVAITPTQHTQLLEQETAVLALAERLGVQTNLTFFYQQLRGESATSFPIEAIGCFVGYWYSRVWADGSVHFCCNPESSLAVGSLHENSFLELWQGEKYAELRQKLHGGQLVNGCDRCGKFDLNCKLQKQI